MMGVKGLLGVLRSGSLALGKLRQPGSGSCSARSGGWALGTPAVWRNALRSEKSVPALVTITLVWRAGGRSDDAGFWLHLSDIVPCEPVPFKGQVGLFKVPYDVAASLRDLKVD